ncbi:MULTISPECIES: L-lactate permease [unclassified Nocardioides]|uniref:L-lactate permease n=1 Tax=unclassified Nocardioides TaxID=2615069 RepID=UPI0009F0DACF|nr:MULTISPECIES: L-lactate permease [unclassified Nocardioides]GAW48905.1 L-lactate permease [Nocardioides sp. PD653-B2]GAW54542.1 L-lactate permease [Nocardioides sp. PD653]
MFQQDLDPVGGSLALSALCGAIPLLTLFVLLGGLKVRAWLSGLISLAVSLVVAIALFDMPTGQALLAGTEGAAFGFFPILWIVINAIWVYNLTVATGHFDVLRRSFEKVSPDQRIQAIIIAFCFGALLEALAGFGTPVAITVVMLMALGFEPLKAAAVALIANTAPVAFGALATPIVTLSTVASGASDASGLDVDTLGAMVGRQTPILALVVPLILVFVVDGKRGLRSTWLAAVVCGVAFAVAQFVASNYISVQLADIVAALVAAAAVVLLLRVWTPADVLVAEPRTDAPVPVTAGSGGRGVGGRGVSAGAAADAPPDSRAEVARAYAPYLVIIAIFSITNITAVKEFLAKEPWTYAFAWPGLDVLNTAGDPVSSTTYVLNWLPAAGTLMIIAGLITAVLLRISPSTMARTYVGTYVELRSAIVTVMAVLGLAYVMNLSGQTGSMGAWLAGAGAGFAILSPILGWIGVAVTGSDTSANALFGALQVQTASQAGLDPTLMAAANSSGGVLGKMVSPQNLAIAAAAVGMAGREGDIFRKVIGWSLGLLLLMCIIVGLQSTPVLGWMVP